MLLPVYAGSGFPGKKAVHLPHPSYSLTLVHAAVSFFRDVVMTRHVWLAVTVFNVYRGCQNVYFLYSKNELLQNGIPGK